MPKFLLDGNLSWKTKDFLEKMGYVAKAIAQFGLSRANDFQIIQFAQKNDYTIITLDLDFGKIYYLAASKKIGIITLKLRDQTIKSVNRALKILLDSSTINQKLLKNSLIIFDGHKIRIRKK